eukprot:GGOE01002601.1.p1 GENE.GGOE01002601.1~~GGOE01002601.1.p1  ORF type:complete len:193 (-),score=14.74 GGOE01002601.1:18-596(-)
MNGVVFWLLLFGCTVAPKPNIHNTANAHLFDAAAVGDVQKVLWAISRGGDPNWFHPAHQISPFMVAVENGHCGVIPQLLAAGAWRDTRHPDTRGTAMHVAATLGNDALLKVLLDHELNVDARDKDGETPLHAASQGRSAGHLRCVEILLQSAGADVTVRNSAGLSPRDVAATTEIRSVLHNAESERARTGEL